MHIAEPKKRRWLVRSISALVLLALAASPAASQQKQEKKDTRLSKTLAGAVLRALGVQSEASESEPAATEITVTAEAIRADEPDVESDPAWQPSMKEVAVIEVGKGWKPYTLNNFCLAPDGNILAACGGDQVRYVQKKPGELDVEIDSVKTELRLFSLDGEQLKSIPVPFKPEALAVLPDGTIFIGGGGRLARLAPDGKVLAAVDSPTVVAARKQKAEEDKSESKPDAEKQGAAKDGQPDEEKPKPEKTEAQKKLEAQQAKMAEAQKKMQERFRLAVTGMAADERDLFVACPESQGYGYTVWRMGHDLKDPVKIVSKLSGCCGQMDIQAHGGDLYVAENGRHRVTRYDREGKQLATFGKRDRKSAEGFGGCCEPKNLRFGPDGDILTAESGPPVAVKRFAPDGRFIEVVALPQFKTGCVRVSVAADKEGRVLVLNGGENKIHVFAGSGPAPSHRQVATITVGEPSSGLRIETFCLDGQGRLLAACVDGRKGESGLVRVLGPDGAKLDEWKLDFAPQSIGVAPDGSVFAGGTGKIARLSPDGKLLATADSPALDALLPTIEDFLPGGPESPEARAKALEQSVESVKKSIEQSVKLSVEAMDRRIEAAKKKGDDKQVEALTQQRTGYEKSLREALQRNVEQMEKSLAAAKEEIEKQKDLAPEELRKAAEEALERAKQQRRGWARVSGIAATDQDVFVCCSARSGFAVYRMTHELKDPKRVVDRLIGCCGQMDIQACGGDLWAAENSRFRVVGFDRDGKQLAAWGKRERQGDGADGFGSCCNPMNLRFGPGGEVYTSESSLGRIKRFDREGKFLGVVGQVKVVPGCKHVPIAVTADGSRVYLLDITRSQIAVLQKRGAVKTASTQ